MSSLPKGESMGTMLIELFANMMVERRNMIISIFEGELALRMLGELISGGVLSFLSFVSFLVFLCFSYLFFAILHGLPLFVSFVSLVAFPSSR
jgi:hypothetical protein